MKVVFARYVDSVSPFVVEVLPDSAVQKSGKPFFIPPFADKFMYRVATAVRICRLGKNIIERFASRYYDEASLCISIEASTLDGLKQSGSPWSEATAFDGAVVEGLFRPVMECGLGERNATLFEDGKEIARFSTCRPLVIDSLVAHVSRFFTVKMGDIIMVETGSGIHEAVIDRRVAVAIGDCEVINLKFK